MAAAALIANDPIRHPGGDYVLAALEDAPFGIAVFDANRRLLQASAGIARLLAVPPGATQPGTPLARLIPSHNDALDTGRFHVKGERWVEWTARPAPLGGRAITLRDISDERKHLAALSRGEARFRDLTELSADWFWETDADFRFTYVSNRQEKIMGNAGHEVLGFRRDQLPSSIPGQEAHFAENLERMKRQESFRNFEYERYDTRHRVRRMSINGAPFFDEEGVFAGYRGTARDVTALAKLSDQLRVERARLEELMSHASVPILFKDTDLRIVTANEAYLKEFDVALTDIVGRTVGDVVADIDLLAVTSMDVDVLAHREPRAREIVHGDRIFSVFKFPVFDKAKTMIGIGAMMFNVTDRFMERQALAEAKTEAERANVAKSNFLARMSHELRTPLNAVIGFGEAMRAEIFGPIEQPRYREYIDDIVHSGEGLLTLVSDILDLSKIEADEFTLHEGEMDLSALTRRAAALTRASGRGEGVALKVMAIDPGIRLRGDSAAIERIVINLVGNALKFTPSGGEVSVALSIQDGAARLEVRDTGIGIPADVLPEITKAFATGGDPLSLNTEGAGLGLAIVRALCDAHGARFDIESMEGVGTLCAVVFPPERVL